MEADARKKITEINLRIRLEMMQPLPSQVLRAFKAARRRASGSAAFAAIQQASRALDIYETAIQEWNESLDAIMRARGMFRLDVANQIECDSFAARIDRRALQKQYVRRVAIAAARVELERLLESLIARLGQ